MFYSAETGGFYVDGQIRPSDAIEVDDDTYASLLQGQAQGKAIISGSDGAPVFSASAEPSLNDVKASLSAAIDAAAERERLKYITPGAGQAMTYQQKADEATRYLAATDPVSSDYPILSAEIGITAAEIGGVAQVIVAAYAQWQMIGAAIEAARLGGKRAIVDAGTEADARAAAAAVTWP